MNAIEINNVSKTYPGNNKKANDNISLVIKKSEILCISGENGAGKTTLMKILSGLIKQDSGEILKNGKIGMVHQHFMLFPGYTVAENIVMGAEPRKARIFFDTKKAEYLSLKIISENNFQLNPRVRVNELTLGEMQQVEICRLLYRSADIVVLDEPTSILTENECQSLFMTLRKLAENGKSVIHITHKLNEIKQIGDRVAVLRNGRLIWIHDVKEIDINEIACMMTGSSGSNYIKTNFSGYNRNVTLQQSGSANAEKNPVLSFDNVTVKRRGQKRPLLDNVSFSAGAGEILGFAGVGGNGLGVIEAVLGGFLHPESGRILHNGKDITKSNTGELRAQGLAYVPADRINVASAQEAAIEENMIINIRHEAFKLFSGLSENKHEEIINKYKIETPGLNEKARALSGGNLQKLILAREISCLKDYIVFSEPTWGLDIVSSQFIKDEIIKLKNKGAAIFLISTNLDEIISLADRIIVMYRGRIAGVYANDGDSAIREKIGKNMQGIIRNAD